MPVPPEDWIVPDWPAPARVRALITTRNGGNSAGPYASLNVSPLVGDDPARVQANRRFLRQFLPGEPKWLDQAHGTCVVNAQTIASPLAADASIAFAPGCVSVVMIADCLPILISDRAGSRVAAVHAGWRGLAAGVIENTVRALDVAPHLLLAYLGPAIGRVAFEVGNDVRDAFLKTDEAAQHAFQPHARGKWLADLPLLARQRLAGLGVTSVYGGAHCTYSEPTRFFSHRRDKVSGRMAALVWIED
jgi:purine-nucleoside/S-methyl-5'-thioadenosine phosphorylase / adenosine deaminase